MAAVSGIDQITKLHPLSAISDSFFCTQCARFFTENCQVTSRST